MVVALFVAFVSFVAKSVFVSRRQRLCVFTRRLRLSLSYFAVKK